MHFMNYVMEMYGKRLMCKTDKFNKSRNEVLPIDEMFQLEFLIGLIAVVVAVVGVGYAIRKWTARIDERLRDIERATANISERLEDVGEVVSFLVYLHFDQIMELCGKFSPSSSDPQEVEKWKLLSKLREGTLTQQEADRLRELLEKRRADALTKGLTIAATAISGLLLLLKYLQH